MHRRLRIAVADDDRDIREYLAAYLTRRGYEVASAGDGRQLVELCRAFAPDVVVTDYAMPGLDGVAAAAAVNRERPVPVVLVSGRTDLEQLADGGRGHVVACLAKPVREADLEAAVEGAASPGEAALCDRAAS